MITFAKSFCSNAAVLLCLTAVLNCFHSGAAAQELGVGLIMPLSGAASGNARYGRDGALLAHSQGVSKRVKLYFEDYGSDPAKAVSAYQKLKNVDHVHAFLVFGSPAAMAVRSLVERDGNVMLAIASAQDLTKAGGSAFRLVSSAAEESKFIVKTFGSSREAKVSIVHVDDDYGESYLRELKALFESTGVGSLEVKSFLPKETDFRPLINQLRIGKPDVVILAAFAQPVGLFLRQARELNFHAKFVCPLACHNPDLFTMGQGGEEGLFVTTPVDAKEVALSKEYVDRFHDEPNFISWGFYDAILMLEELAPRCVAHPEVGRCLRENLLRPAGFATSRGQIAFDERGEMPFQLNLLQAKEGKLVPAQSK